jgi:hypothetical protein
VEHPGVEPRQAGSALDAAATRSISNQAGSGGALDALLADTNNEIGNADAADSTGGAIVDEAVFV